MTKEQFIAIYKAFVILGAIPTPSMTESACSDVRKANRMIWDALSGMQDDKSINDYAKEIGVNLDDVEVGNHIDSCISSHYGFNS